MRLVVSVLLAAMGSSGMFIVSVALPQVQAEFGVTRSEASLPYTVTMIGLGLGSILMGRISDRIGIMWPVLFGTLCLSLGYILSSKATSLGQYTATYGLLIGLLGSSATFGPLIADTSLWFSRRRGLAVGICASGNYLGGALWPTVAQHFFQSTDWRQTFFGIGCFCLAVMLPLALLLRRRPAAQSSTVPSSLSTGARSLGLSPNALQTLLCVAGVACCVAMSMPQVHIVAYCGDLGYGPARGAQMLSMMLGFGIVSRITFGIISDRVGGVRTLIIGSALQGLALLMFIPFDSLASLYVISAMFGLFQGGIVPSYAIIVRENFSPKEAGVRVTMVLTATMFGMALGGWLSGAIFDLTGSYNAAFMNGMAWNGLNLVIATWLLRRSMRRRVTT
ncbi:MAG: MFS transporter [Betaproteobacteria bacterium]|nr:MFS transporter [Betaproteobacteria bacterium]